MNRNLVGSIYGRSSITIAHFVLICNKKEEFEDTKVAIRIRILKKTTQWPKEKVQKYKQRSTKHTYKTKDRETRTPLKTGGAPLVAPVVLI